MQPRTQIGGGLPGHLSTQAAVMPRAGVSIERVVAAGPRGDTPRIGRDLGTLLRRQLIASVIVAGSQNMTGSDYNWSYAAHIRNENRGHV